MFHNMWNLNIRWLISLALLLTLVIPAWAGGDTGCGCSYTQYCACPPGNMPCQNKEDDCSAAGCKAPNCYDNCGDVCVNADPSSTQCQGLGSCAQDFCEAGDSSCTCGGPFCFNSSTPCGSADCSQTMSLLAGGSLLAPMAGPAPKKCTCGKINCVTVILGFLVWRHCVCPVTGKNPCKSCGGGCTAATLLCNTTCTWCTNCFGSVCTGTGGKCTCVLGTAGTCVFTGNTRCVTCGNSSCSGAITCPL